MPFISKNVLSDSSPLTQPNRNEDMIESLFDCSFHA
jgi:hypothetical protein